MRPGPSLCSRPIAFHLLHNNNPPLSLSLAAFISSLSIEMFPLAHKHTINPSTLKKNKAYLDPLRSLQVSLLFSLLITHVHKSCQHSLSPILSSYLSRTQLQQAFHSHPNSTAFALIRLIRTFYCQIPPLT